MESFGTCSDGRVDDRMRRLQQQLEEMEIRAQESAKRVEEEGSRVGQLQRELAGKTREVQLARGSLSSEQHLQERTREVASAREQHRECKQHLQERTREVTSAREEHRECEQHVQERTREVASETGSANKFGSCHLYLFIPYNPVTSTSSKTALRLPQLFPCRCHFPCTLLKVLFALPVLFPCRCHFPCTLLKVLGHS